MFVVYDKDGKEFTTPHSIDAREMVATGEYFIEPPKGKGKAKPKKKGKAKVVDLKQPAPKKLPNPSKDEIKKARAEALPANNVVEKEGAF